MLVDGRAISMAQRIPCANKFHFCQSSLGWNWDFFHSSRQRFEMELRIAVQSKHASAVKWRSTMEMMEWIRNKNVSLIYSIFRTWESIDWRWTTSYWMEIGEWGCQTKIQRDSSVSPKIRQRSWRQIIRGNCFTFVGAKVKRSDLETALEFRSHRLLGEQWIPTTIQRKQPNM